MKIIVPKDPSIQSYLKSYDKNLLKPLIDFCMNISQSEEIDSLYNKLYQTKYRLADRSIEDSKLSDYLVRICQQKGNLRIQKQGNSYNWIVINERNIGKTDCRFYFAPNPAYLHQIVQKLTNEFSEGNIPVKFKYQLNSKQDKCDRIIVYSDYQNKKNIEDAISRVYMSNYHLFTNSERPVSWLYESRIPNVYFAPETPGFSYGEEFARTMLESKRIVSYLYNLTKNHNEFSLEGEEVKKALNYVELVINSLLLRNGLLLTNDYKRIVFKDNIKTMYNYETGVLKSMCRNRDGFHEAEFSQNRDGKEALFSNFYNVSQLLVVNSTIIKGLNVKHLNLEEFRILADNTFHPHQVSHEQRGTFHR